MNPVTLQIHNPSHMDSNLGIINHKVVVLEKTFSMFCYTFQLKVFLTPLSNVDN